MTTNPANPVDLGEFEELQNFDLDYAPVNLSAYRHPKTHFTFSADEHDSGLVKGYFILGSECFDDSGAPHTLEHLTFMGSEDLPYKGVLDKLANRAGGNGTNAWTATSHTVYTLQTATSKGFLSMLGPFLSHILKPLLTQDRFLTEVHHINGAGEHRGVVYDEMQGRENKCVDRMCYEIYHKLFPEGSGYRSEIGGLQEALRALTLEKIQDFHSEIYQSRNLRLHVAGPVNKNELLKTINSEIIPMIQELEAKRSPKPWKRPFMETASATPLSIDKSEIIRVPFMAEDEKEPLGQVAISYVGPQLKDRLERTALTHLNSYLSHSEISPLRNAFVERDDGKPPLAGDVSFYEDTTAAGTLVTCWLDNVATKDLDTEEEAGSGVGAQLKAKLADLAESGNFDMKRMQRILDRHKRLTLKAMEDDPTEQILYPIIADFLYGDVNGANLKEALDLLKSHAEFSAWTEENWTNLFKKYYGPHVDALITAGYPSKSHAEKVTNAERDRTDANKRFYGPEGLKKLADEHAAAKASHLASSQLPDTLYDRFPMPSPDEVTTIRIERAVNNAPGEVLEGNSRALQKCIDSDGDPLPYQVHYSHFKSNFVEVEALFDASTLPAELRPYLSVLSDTLFKLPVKRNGEIFDHKNVINQLQDSTISRSAGFSYLPGFFGVAVETEKEQYADAVSWLRDVITNSVFDPKRLSVSLRTAVQKLPENKQSGNLMAKVHGDRLLYHVDKSIEEANGLLSQFELYPQLLKQLESQNPHEVDGVISKLEALRKYLLEHSNLRVSVMGDIYGLDKPRSTLSEHFLPINKPNALSPPVTSRDTLTELGKNPSKTGVVVPVPGEDSSYSYHYGQGPIGYDHPDRAALKVVLNLLDAQEGPVHAATRGDGEGYSSWFSSRAESGIINFTTYRHPDGIDSYNKVGKVIPQFAQEGSFDQRSIEGAKSISLHNTADLLSNASKTAQEQYRNVLLGLDPDYDMNLLRASFDMPDSDLTRVTKDWIEPLFSADTSVAVLAINDKKGDDGVDSLNSLGFNARKQELPRIENAEDDEEEPEVED